MAFTDRYKLAIRSKLWTDHRIFSPFEAWMDIISSCDDTGTINEWCYDSFSKRWSWSISDAKKFIHQLRDDGQLQIVKNLDKSGHTIVLLLSTMILDENPTVPAISPGMLIGSGPDFRKARPLDWQGLIGYLNDKTGKSLKTINRKVRKAFMTRLNEGYTRRNIMTAIDNACLKKHHIDNGFQYLTPEFFSRTETLDKYGSSPVPKPTQLKLREHAYNR